MKQLETQKPVCPAAKHQLKYFLSASSGLQTFPEFMAFSMVDDVRGGYCDSGRKRPEPTQDWTRKLIEDYPQLLEWYGQECVRYQNIYRAHIDILKQQMNQTGGMLSSSKPEVTASDINMFLWTHSCSTCFTLKAI